MRNNAEVPSLRPKILANDTASSASVILHLLRYLEKKKRIFNNILLLEPTSPLREPKDINKCLSILKQKKMPLLSVLSVPTILIHRLCIVAYLKGF